MGEGWGGGASVTIDLNADLGEGMPWDAALLARVSSASISCGFHAGDASSILATLHEAKSRGVIIGAHPGFADRENLGRKEQSLSGEQALRLVCDQVLSVKTLADEVGCEVRFIKPHGALYNQAQRDRQIARGVVAAAGFLQLPILGLPGGFVDSWADLCRVRFIAEGFADRRYTSDGRLVPRTEPNAILEDESEIAEQVLRLVERKIDTICLHGDNPHSVALSDLVLSTLQKAGIAVRSFLS